MARGHYLQQEVATIAEIALEEIKQHGPVTAHALVQKLGTESDYVTRAINHLVYHGKLQKTGKKNSRSMLYSYNPDANPKIIPARKPKAALVPCASVEIPKSVLKLLVHDIVDRGETLSPELQRATFKAMSVLI